MNEENLQEEVHYARPKILLPVKRHINLGNFHNAETKVYVTVSEEFLTGQLEKLREARQALNIWESEERANYVRMREIGKRQEEAILEQERLEQDKKDAEFRKKLLEYINANPKCGIDDLVLTFEVSRNIIENHIYSLQNQGKIKRAECREAFLIDDEEEEEDP